MTHDATPTDVSSRILAAATLAEQAAVEFGVEIRVTLVSEPGTEKAQALTRARTAASGPSHWGAVAELLRETARLHDGGHECPGDRFIGYYEADSEIGLVACPTVAAVLPLADQIIRDLGASRPAGEDL